MPILINSNPYLDTPAYKIEEACEKIIHIFAKAKFDKNSALTESECDQVLECTRIISDLRSKL